MSKQYVKITKEEIKSLINWAFYSGKNNVSDFYFEMAKTEYIKQLEVKQ